jgi:hypothetical protein
VLVLHYHILMPPLPLNDVLCFCHLCVTAQCLEVLVSLRRELERRQLLALPRVHVSPSLGPETQRLREYVRRLQGNLAERAGGAVRG